ncbi:MAG TPA: BrnA antitoxin family protein [Caulobacteraceae bacterium]
MPDEEIDLSDIPEIPDSAVLYRPIKQPVTIRLDADIVSWFKQQAGDRPYQTEINSVLRKHVTDALKRRA